MIGFKGRETLSEDQIARIFPHCKPSHLTVILTPQELDPPPKPPVVLPVLDTVAACGIDPLFLAPVSQSIGGVISDGAVAWSCGRFSLEGQAVGHQHDPAEWDLCRQIATDAADRLNAPWVGEEYLEWGAESPVPPGRPYFAVAVVGEPVPVEIDPPLIRAVFGHTIHPNVIIQLTPLERHDGRWPPYLGSHVDPSRNGEFLEASDAFGRWFHALEGLRDHSFVEIGMGDPDPGAVKPRMILALTTAGSLVGVASYVVQA